MNLDTLRTRLLALGLPKIEEVLASAKPATVLKPISPTDPASPDSRIGGLPLLGPGVDWPRYDGVPLAFLAQVRLDPLEGAAMVLGLPRTGLLSFFYDVNGQPWGFDPKDRGAFAILYTEDPEGTPATPYPDDFPPDSRISPVSIAPEPTVTLPTPGSRAFPSHLLNREGFAAWSEAFVDLAYELGWADRTVLGGHPCQIQNDMSLECEIVAVGGASTGSGEAHGDPRMAEWERRAGEWVHLLQIASEERAGLMWGDSGCLYYWMKKDDLEAGRFERGWLILQCA